MTSSYRSYAEQLELLASNPDEDDLIALPGHSEHQLGTTVDLADGDEWLARNASRFGFVMSFPPARSPSLDLLPLQSPGISDISAPTSQPGSQPQA